MNCSSCEILVRTLTKCRLQQIQEQMAYMLQFCWEIDFMPADSGRLERKQVNLGKCMLLCLQHSGASVDP